MTSLTPEQEDQLLAYALGKLNGPAAQAAHDLLQSHPAAQQVFEEAREQLVIFLEYDGLSDLPEGAEERLMARLQEEM